MTQVLPIGEADADVGQRRRKPRRHLWAAILYHGVMLLICAIFLLPFWWMAISAFKNNAEIFADPITWFPNPIRLENIVALFTREEFPFLRQFMNSVFYAGMVAIGVCFSCSLAAYSFACLRWRGRNLVFMLTISALLLPAIVTFLPVYLGWSRAGLVGTYWPLIAPFFLGDAFFIFMLRQFFLGIPRELFDAARLDGASEFRIWWQIAIPQVRTPLVIVALFAIVWTWHEFFGPLIYLQDREDFPLALGLFTFRSQHAVEWSITMAGALFTALPLVILFLFTQRLFQQGLMTSRFR
jgi:multiple sugar transport system permease protein